MNNKLRLMILAIFVAIFMFGTKTFAQIEDEAKGIEASNPSPDKVEGEVTESEKIEPNMAIENDEMVLKGGEKETPVSEAAPTEGVVEEKKETGVDEKLNGENKESTEVKNEEPDAEVVGETKNEASNPVKGEEPKKEEEPKTEINPNSDKELSDLKAKIDGEKDEKKKAELQKEYNEKYFQAIEEKGKDKIDPEVQERLTKSEDIKDYNLIKSKQKELNDKKIEIDKKISEGKYSKDEIEKLNKEFSTALDEYNNLIGKFDPPRKLTSQEIEIRKDYKNKPYINIDHDKTSKEGNETFEEYEKYKAALDKALNPNDKGLKKEDYDNLKVKDLDELKKKFDELNKKVLDMIDNKTIIPSFADEKGNPKVDVYPYDFTGTVDLDNKLENEKNYYIPDGTPLDIFVQVGRENNGKEIEFIIEPSKIGNPKGGELSARDQVIFLNGTEYPLEKNENGTYSFKTNNNFGVAQLIFSIPEIYGELHEGFKLTMKVGDKTISNAFLITKKGYDDKPETGSIGNSDKEKPTTEDAGETENAKVSEYTDKVFDIFAKLKESNGYIDEVLVNSKNGEALPLAHVVITMTLPKNYDGKFAEYIQSSGLAYEKREDGKYVLELKTEEFGKNLVEDGGKFYLLKDNQKIELEKASSNDLLNAVLEGKNDKTYIDKNGKSHKITETKEVKEDEESTYRIEGNKLYKKNNQSGDFEEIGDLVNNIVTKDGKTYEYRQGTLLIYTDTKDVYEGHVINKDGKANQTVTPTIEGIQVTVETTEKNDKNEDVTRKSFGGTIVENGIFDKSNKYVADSNKKLLGKTEVWIDETGKMVDNLKDISEDENTSGKKIVGDKIYTKVKNSVFNEQGYIVDGLTFKEKFSIVDKFGTLIQDITVEQDANKNYIFHKLQGEKIVSTITTNPTTGDCSGDTEDRKIKVDNDKRQILVDTKNDIVEKTGEFEKPIIGKYYYDKKAQKFIPVTENVIGDKYYENLKKTALKNKNIETYEDENKTVEVPGDAKRYFGSEKVSDYYKLKDGSKIFYKETIGEGENAKVVFIGKDEILTKESSKKIVKVFKDGKTEIVDEKSILDAINNAKFKIRFPGFLAGDNIVYNLKTDIIADYVQIDENGNPEKVSIFKDENDPKKQAAAGTSKEIIKYFKLKNEHKNDYKFFKERPHALDKNLDYNFFNIFFRDGSDRQRDEYISKLLEIEEKSKTDEDKKKNKEQLDFLNLLRKELRRLTGNDKADFKFVENGSDKKLTIVERASKEGEEDKIIEIDRTLLWKVGFNNSEGALFPEDSDSQIIIEDHNMDNRLVYDEIIINEKRDDWEKAYEAYKTAKAELEKAKNADSENSTDDTKAKLKAAEEKLKAVNFNGNGEYFFLDQINRIFLGVNPNYVEYGFIPAGEKYVITKDQIVEALKGGKDKGEITLGSNEKPITVVVSRDKKTGQIKLKVFDVFYKKNNSETDKTHHYSSPIQEAYQEKVIEIRNKASNLSEDSIDSFKTAFEELIKKTYGEKSDCYKVLKRKFEKMLENIKKESPDEDAKLQKIREIKADLVKEMQKLDLAYLDKEKNGGKYKFDDMRFNGIRIELEPGESIGGAIDDAKRKYIGISSVLVPDVDIPFTDEFGDLLTNKDLYLKQEVDKILKRQKTNDGKVVSEKTFESNEELYKSVMAEAYEEVKKLKDTEGKSVIKTLVKIADPKKYGIEKYTVKRGNEFAYGDFAVGNGENRKSLKDQNGRPVNAYYVGDGSDDKVTTIEKTIGELLASYNGKVDAEKFRNSEMYQKLIDQKIEIGIYYMHEQGFNRAFFANKANFKLNKVGQGPGIFGDETNWKNKVCYPGIIGKCLSKAGGDSFPPEEGEKTQDEDKMKAEDKFRLSFSPTGFVPETENPKLDKTSGTKDIDLSKDKDKRIDYKVELIVDKLRSDQKIAENALIPDKEQPKTDKKESDYYNKRGYFVYENSLLIDILPKIFKLEKDSTIELEINEEALKENGANTGTDFDFKTFKESAKPLYFEDVYKYYDSLDDKDPKKETLKKAIELAELKGQLDRNSNRQAVLVWLPKFEAPHGASKPQFTLKINKLAIDIKQFKEYENNKGTGEIFTNHAAFDILYAGHKITIRDGHEGTVDKTMRIYDENGEVINKEKAEEWFRGNVELKFGDKFDYKIRYKYEKPGYTITDQSTNRDEKGEFVDIFGSEENTKNGLRPVLRELLNLKDGYYAEYKIKGNEAFFTKEQIETQIAENKINLSDIIGVKIKHKVGFKIGEEVEFVLPMMIPKLDAKIENGKVVYTGTDGNDVVLGNAKEFFNLEDLNKYDKDVFATNTVDKSNTVTVYLEKERFIKLFKKFFEADKKTEITENRPEVKFDIYQIAKDEDGKETRIKLDKGLTLNEDNKFVDKIDHLPLFKRIENVDEKGKVTVKIISYTYEVEEQEINGYKGKVFKFDEKDALGFVLKAQNYKKPNNPPEEPKNPPEEPKNPPEEPKNPPEEPKEPPEKPEEPPEKPEEPPEKPEEPPKKPEEPDEPIEPHEPNQPGYPGRPGEPNLPKTGVKSEMMNIWLGIIMLLGLCVLKKKLYVK